MQKINNFSDFRFIPFAGSDVDSRSMASTVVNYFGHRLTAPVVIPAMSSLWSIDLMDAAWKSGILSVEPRREAEENYFSASPVMNVSVQNLMRLADHLEQCGLTDTIISVELNNGYLTKLYQEVFRVKKKYPNRILWVGAVTDLNGCIALADSGADAALVGLGVGSACLTTPNTGYGLPAARALIECQDSPIPTILLGGIREIGDIAKALYLGADLVMVGHMMKGVNEAASRGAYWGQASAYEKGHANYVEGAYIEVTPVDKGVEDVVKEIEQGLQSAMSFANAFTIEEFRNKAQAIVIK